MNYAFLIPPGIRQVQPHIEILQPHTAKTFLLTVSVDGVPSDQLQTVYENYPWSDNLKTHYRYFSEQVTAPAIAQFSPIYLPDNTDTVLTLSIKKWGNHPLASEDVIGQVVLSFASSFGPSIIHPTF